MYMHIHMGISRWLLDAGSCGHGHHAERPTDLPPTVPSVELTAVIWSAEECCSTASAVVLGDSQLVVDRTVEL